MKKPVAALALFLVIFFAYLASPNITSFDSRWSVPIALSLIREGDTDLDEYAGLLEKEGYYHIRRVNGHAYSYFPAAPSLIAVPFVLLADALLEPVATRFPQLIELIRQRSHEPIDEINVLTLRQPIELVIASFLSALSVVFLYLVIRQRTQNPRLALLGGLLFAFGTSLWSVVSRGLWQHGPTILIATVVLFLLGRPNPRGGSFVCIGLLLGFAVAIRPTNAIPSLLLTLYIVLEHRKHLLLYLLGLAAVLLTFVAYSWSIYRAPLPPYYSPSRLIPSSAYGEALLGNLVSPARGLFVFSPFLLFAVVAVIRRRGTLTRLERIACLIVLLHWLAVSIPRYWWGGHTYGPRYFSDVLPYIFFLLIPMLEAFFREHRPRWTAAGALFILFVAWSIFVHAKGALDWDVYLWNSQPTNVDQNHVRLWSWRDLQFLR